MSTKQATTDAKPAATKQRPQHLCIRPLTIYDLDQADKLEAEGFKDVERASKEKIEYRLTVAPELSSGLFVREFEDVVSDAKKLKKGDSDLMDESGDIEFPPPRSTIKTETLIGHILGSKQYDPKITARSMAIPKLTTDNLPDATIPGNEKVGHVEKSRTIGVHSVVIAEKYRGLKLGSLLLKDYLQKMNQQCVGDRVVIIAKQALLPFYQALEFVDDGISAEKFGGSEWHDMHCVLTHEEDDDEM